MKRSDSGSRRAAMTVLIAAAACSGGEVEKDATPYERGKKIYNNVCIACHAADPSQIGTLGPPIAGSSRKLIEYRVLRGTYPPGYEPKRASRTMPQFPHLEEFVDDLAAYLAVPES